MVFELTGQMLVGLVILGGDHHTGGVLVETMNDAGPQLATNTREILAVMQQSVDQRAALVSRRRVHHKMSRLVNNDQGGILVKNRQRNRFGLGCCRNRFRQNHTNLFAPPQLDARLTRGPIQGDSTLIDKALDLRAGNLRQIVIQETIQAHRNIIGADLKAAGFRHAIYQIELSILPACLIMTSTIARS